MKNICEQLLLKRMPIVCLCLLACWGSVSAGESGNEPQSTEKTGTDTHGDQKKTEGKREDVLDRAFSPLDRAVSDINQDINRDINKEDDKQAPAPHE